VILSAFIKLDKGVPSRFSSQDEYKHSCKRIQEYGELQRLKNPKSQLPLSFYGLEE